MVFALVGDSTTTRAPRPRPEAVASGSRGAAPPRGAAPGLALRRRAGRFASFTSLFLAATHQPLVNDDRTGIFTIRLRFAQVSRPPSRPPPPSGGPYPPSRPPPDTAPPAPSAAGASPRPG